MIQTITEELEFIRPKPASRQFGISCRTIADLIRRGLVTSHLVTMPGRRRGGIRLIEVRSLREFVAGHRAPAESVATKEETP